MTIIDENNFPKIKITHVPTNTTVNFEPYIESFSDNFNSMWDSTPVFGRMDEIKNFKQTTRTISLAWNVIGESEETARQNYINCSTLMAMLYPVYNTTAISNEIRPVEVDLQNSIDDIRQRISDAADTAEDAQINSIILNDLNNEIETILSSVRNNERSRNGATNTVDTREAAIMSSPPIFKINFSNLIKNSNGNELYGTIEGFKYEPDPQMGFFIEGLGTQQMMYPKVVSLSFAFTVIHTSKLGWKYDETLQKYILRDRTQNFPFFKKLGS